MIYLIEYSDRHEAIKKGWPLAGSTVEVRSIEDLHNLVATDL